MEVFVTRQRLQHALLCFSALAVIALGTLDGPFRLVVLIVLAGLAVKIWIAYLREREP